MTGPFAPHCNRDIGKILVRSTNWIGDAVMTTPALGMIRTAFPEAEIVVVANPMVAELFRFHPYCDGTIIYDKKTTHKSIPGFIRFCRYLRKERFDLAILFQNAVEAAVMARLSGISLRWGYGTDGRAFLLTHSVPIGKQERLLHHVDYYRNMLNVLGIEGEDRQLHLTCTDQEISWARSLLHEGKWLAINPGAAYGSAKRWFPERFASVADALTEESSTGVVLIGSSKEIEIGKEIQSWMKHPALNLVGKTSVRRMMAIVSQCSLMLTNDSGPMHIAAALNIPTVAIFGPTDHRTTSPLTTRCRIVRKATECAPCLLRQCPTDHRCMQAISAKDVLKAAKDLLGETA